MSTNALVKAAKRFGDAFDRETFVTTNPRVLQNQAKFDEIKVELGAAMSNNDMEGLKNLIESKYIK